MRIRSLAINQFKKFTIPTRLDGIQDGLNVVVGPNEMGKSTLLDAFRAVLFERHTSKARPITALQNDRNQAAPVVELTFELEHDVFRITKRFVKKPYAKLTCPDGRILEGDNAEASLRSLLGFYESGNTGAKPDTMGMWNILWVQQGWSFRTLDVPDSARTNLHSALESEVGNVLGGRRGRALPQSIEKQLEILITSNGRPRGNYKELNERIETMRSELEGLALRRQELTDTLNNLEDSEATLERLSSSELIDQEKQELEDTQKRFSERSDLESNIVTAHIELELRKQKLEQVNQKSVERDELKTEIESLKEKQKKSRQRLVELGEKVKEAQAHHLESRTSVERLEVVESKAEESLKRSRRILVAVEYLNQINKLEQQHQKALASEVRQREALASAAAILVTDEVLAGILEADKEHERVKNRLDASATLVSFEMKSDAFTGIEVDGTPVTSDQSTIRIVKPTDVTIPGRGRILIEPGIKDRDKLLGQLLDAKNQLRTVLEEGGAETVSDAEDQYVRRQKLLQDAEFASQEVELYAPATDEHPAGAQSLSDYIERIRQALGRDMDLLQLDDLPTLQSARNSLHDAQLQAEDEREKISTARAAMVGPVENLNSLTSERDTLQGGHDENNKRFLNLEENLKQLEGEQSDEELHSAIEKAINDVSEQEMLIVELEEQRTDETLPQLEARIARLEKAIQVRNDKRSDLKIEIAGLKSRVEADGGVGLDEAIGDKNRELERAEIEQQRMRREVQVLNLLLSTLQKAEKEAMEQYLSPVLKHVLPYLQLLFPGADLLIDQNLQIQGVERVDGYVEDFYQLSMGTQEQVAVLVRLAFAEMLAEQGYPATVILDDALVFSDDRRMNRMFDILNMAAQRVQIIILTCREQLFERLGGNQLRLSDTDIDNLETA